VDAGKYTFDQLGVAVSAFLREVVGRPAIVGGNSSGGVLTMWLAANAPELVTASIIEDAPFFRAEWPAIKTQVVYDVFLGLAQTAIPGSGGFPKFFLDTLAPMAQELGTMSDMTVPCRPSHRARSDRSTREKHFAGEERKDRAYDGSSRSNGYCHRER